MSTTAAVPSAPPRRARRRAQPWFFEFLRRELAPFPGRASMVARMVAAATLTMLIIMTFHLPAGALGGYFALVISRESLRNTAQQAWLTVLFFGLGTIYVLLGIALFVDSPVTHFLWVIGSFYLIFFVMGTARNYGLAAGFSFLIATAIPIWDRPGEVNAKVALTLYVLLSVAIGTMSTFVVELVYRSFHPQDPVITGIADRLHVAARVLDAAAAGAAPEKMAEARLLQYAMVGPSRLRRQLIRAGQPPEVRARAAAVVSMSGRLVELCAATLHHLELGLRPSQDDRQRLRALGAALEQQATLLARLPDVTSIGASALPSWRGGEAQSQDFPILPELERSVRLMSEMLNSFGLRSRRLYPPQSGIEEVQKSTNTLLTMLGGNPSSILVEDAFSNRDYLIFALRGCLAASLCYVIYNAIDWPGISTSVATCIITALGTIGSSRQKQLLRISGAFAGGFLIAVPAQVFLLPLMDSITAFTLFFAAVSAIAAWFATSSPRLSYFGLQLALAFYLVNLQEPFRQISLDVARDRVVGVLLGLVAMWLVFDHIAAPLATERMGTLLKTNLNLLGDIGCAIGQVWHAGGHKQAAHLAREHFRQLRDRLNDSFSQMNAQGDAVPFEFGTRRAEKLRELERMQAMQPPMRSLFLLEITLFESDHLPAGVGGRVDAVSAAAVGAFLGRTRRALNSIAALPAPAHRPSGSEQRAMAKETKAIVADIQESFDRTQEQLEQQHAALLTLCASMVSALGALARAATEPVDWS